MSSLSQTGAVRNATPWPGQQLVAEMIKCRYSWRTLVPFTSYKLDPAHVLVWTPPKRLQTPETEAMWRHWNELASRLMNGTLDMTVEEFAPIVVTFNKLLETGFVFDRMLTALMTTLAAQIINEDDDFDASDPDMDGSDAQTDN